MIHSLVLAALTALPSCWSIFDSGLVHNASGAHPPYVQYSERINVFQDGEPLVTSFANVDYRDDGMARVSDERFDYQPFITRRTEPGPPELGPYGAGREMWLPDTMGLPVIAHVHAMNGVTCHLAGEEAYKGHDTYHLIFTGAGDDVPHVKELWVDRTSRDMWKLIVTGPVSWSDGTRSRRLAEFQVELGYSGPYLVVKHVVWSYRRREYSQYSDYFGEYTFTGYRFPKSVPDGYFADTSGGNRL